MTRPLFASLALALIALAVPRASDAAAYALRPWLSAAATYARYDMGDVNRDIDSFNASLLPDDPKMDRIEGAAGLALAAGMDFPNHLGVRFAYQRFPAWSEVSIGGDRIEYNFAGNAFIAGAEFQVPLGESLDLSLGGEAGLVSLAGKVGIAIAALGSGSIDAHGNGPLAAGVVRLTNWWGDRYALEFAGAVRSARVAQVTTDRDLIVYNADGTKYSVDWSGIGVSAAFKVALPY